MKFISNSVLKLQVLMTILIDMKKVCNKWGNGWNALDHLLNFWRQIGESIKCFQLE